VPKAAAAVLEENSKSKVTMQSVQIIIAYFVFLSFDYNFVMRQSVVKVIRWKVDPVGEYLVEKLLQLVL